MNWIQTASGAVFDLENPDPQAIRLEEIALGLSREPRFSGQTDPLVHAYSVAQHCVLGSYVVPNGYAIAFLLHDASEAYTGDITKPLKRLIAQHTDVLQRTELTIQRAINVRYRLTPDAHLHPIIHHADLAMLSAERRALMVKPPVPWADDTAPANLGIWSCDPWSPGTARSRFMARARQLGIVE